MALQRFWCGTVSRDHVRRGVAGSFAQVCHGKSSPLSRMKEGDWLVYYSPKESMNGKAPLQKMTAIGRVVDGKPYRFDMGGGFIPSRINVAFLSEAKEVSISPLIPRLSFIKNKSSWGQAFRFGLIEISSQDFGIIAEAMGVKERILLTDPTPLDESSAAASLLLTGHNEDTDFAAGGSSMSEVTNEGSIHDGDNKKDKGTEKSKPRSQRPPSKKGSRSASAGDRIAPLSTSLFTYFKSSADENPLKRQKDEHEVTE